MKKAYGDQNGKNPKNGVGNTLSARRDARQTAGGRADYATATPGWLQATIVAVTAAGGAIRFGYSRDGGVYAIGIYLGGEQEKYYIKQSEGLDVFLEEIYNDFSGEAAGSVGEGD